MNYLKKISLLLITLIAFSSCSSDDDNAVVPQAQNIVEIALASPNLSSLVAALSAADGDLVNVLGGDGPFTVLAPTNEAFAAFLAANNFGSLEEVPTDVLSQILLNHVIMANVTASDLTTAGAGYTNTSASGPNNNAMSLYFNTSDGVTFNGVSTVSTADIEASNGTIHIVDAVIGIPTVVTFAAADPSFATLVTALTELTPATDFVDILQGEGPFTVFAPTNDAFSALPAIPAEEPLTQVLLYHVVGGNIEVTQVSANGFSITLSVFRDCDGQVDPDGGISIYEQGTNNLISSPILPSAHTPYEVVLGDSCYTPTGLCVEQWTFTGPVTLPNNANGYYVVWGTCCRNAGIDNLASPSTEGSLFYTEFPNPALGMMNSTPVFG